MIRRGAALVLACAAALAGCTADEAEPTSSANGSLCAGGVERVIVISRLGFSREGPVGVADGFDLDGVASTGDDEPSCRTKDFIDPDGRVGIDNQVASILPDIDKVFGNAIDGLVQGAVNNGELLLALRLQNVDDLENDDCVSVALETIRGVPMLDTQGEILGDQTFDPDPATPRNFLDQGRIQGGLLTIGPGAIAIPLKLFDVSFTLHVYGGRVRLAIDDAGYAKGVLGGGIDYDELIQGVRVGAGVEPKVPLIRAVLSGGADLGPDEDGNCRLISAALEVGGVPAFVRSAPSRGADAGEAGASAGE